MIARGDIRASALAGRWYPGDAATLTREVEGYLARARLPESLSALASVATIVSPHAGLVYSGGTAGHAWASVARTAPHAATRIVIVGPAHRVAFKGVALGDFAAYRIPTGDVPVDRAALAALEARHPQLVSFVPGAHDAEHCLEIQLPFVQAVLPGVPIVPLLAGGISPAELATVLDAVLRPGDLLVVSTDLSHFHPYEDARARDLATLQSMAGLAPFDLGGEDACGYRGVAAGALIARLRGYLAVLLDYSNSGDTGGDRGGVVGYGALAMGPPRS